MKKLVYILIGLLVLSSCAGNDSDNKKVDFTISGKIEGAKMAYFNHIDIKNLNFVDSIKIAEDGSFSFSDTLRDPKASFYIFNVDGKPAINLIINKGDDIVIEGTADNFYRNYNITGSPSSEEMRELDINLHNTIEATDTIFAQAKRSQKSEFERMQFIFDSTMNKHRQATINFIKSHPNSLANIVALSQKIKGRRVLDFYEDQALYKTTVQNLFEHYPGHPHVVKFAKILPSVKAPEFRMKNTEDEYVSLNELKGKYIILNFWASWDQTAVNELKLLKRLQEEYKDENLEIVSISYDGINNQSKPKDDWIQAINRGNFNWIHLSELNGWSCSISKPYNVPKIPYNILIDPNGDIIKIRASVVELKQKFTKLFDK